MFLIMCISLIGIKISLTPEDPIHGTESNISISMKLNGPFQSLMIDLIIFHTEEKSMNLKSSHIFYHTLGLMTYNVEFGTP